MRSPRGVSSGLTLCRLPRITRSPLASSVDRPIRISWSPAAKGSVPSLCTQTTLVAAPVNARRPVAGASTALAGGSTACDAFEQAAAVARTTASATSPSRG